MSRVHLGCCITPHGLGHAARACAVLEAVAARLPVHFEIISTVPRWFFAESLTVPFTLHPLLTDIGLVQHDSLRENLAATLSQLDAFYPLQPELLRQAAAILARCRLVLCDIAPLGIAAAELAREQFAAPVESVLLENFTWDWIYETYAAQAPAFKPHITYLSALFQRADYHLQAEPICTPSRVNCSVPPIARSTRQPRKCIRAQLHLEEADQVVLVTMGGIPGTELPVEQMLALPERIHFLLAGQAVDTLTQQGNLHLLPQKSGFWHPDLIAASDAVVGKIGYSTLAETFQAGIPYGAVCRQQFRESEALSAFVAQEMPGLLIEEEQFQNGTWLELLPDLLSQKPRPAERQNGAEAVANFLVGLLD
jgi:UDP-N-acetylglucosamine:LPS N-acetylglucosamine transferase